MKNLSESEEKRCFIDSLQTADGQASGELLRALQHVAHADDGMLLIHAGMVAAVWGAPWDTDHFGYPIGHLGVWHLPASEPISEQAAEPLLRWGIAEIMGRGWDLVYSRVEGGAWAVIHALERSGFQIMDQLVTFEGATVATQMSQPSCVVRPFRVDDTRERSEVEALAMSTFAHSRFYSDVRLDRARVDDMFRNWTAAAVNKGLAYVADSEGRVAGYLACALREDAVIIDLIAVAPWARGRGIGKALVSAVRSTFYPRQSRLVVGTQLVNREAIALYTSCGLRLARAELTFHLWTK